MDFVYLAITIVISILCTILIYFVYKQNSLSDPVDVKKRKRLYNLIAKQKSVTLVSDVASLESAWADFAGHIQGIVGLDCEWTTKDEGEAMPVALLQLALPTGHCLLIRTSHLRPIRSSFPLSLREMLANPRILKFGVAVTQDATKFLHDHGLQIRGCVDLRHLVVRIRNNGLKRRGLKNIADKWLGIVYESGKHVQCSVWDVDEPLSPLQMEYSAMDALVAVYAVAEFLYRKHKLETVTAVNDFQQLLVDELTFQKMRPFTQGLVDKPFKIRWLMNDPILRENLNGEKSTPSRNSTTFEKHNKIPQRKSRLYTNAVMLDPDGEILCTLDVRKANWYLDKNLATLVQAGEDRTGGGLVIKLNFEPSSRETGKDWEFYIQEKVNQCVVCGNADGYARKHIVPTEYRKHFPSYLKSHKSHDVLLLCLPCHRHSSIIDDDLKRQLAAEYDAPQGTLMNVAYKVDFDAVTICRAAKALKRAGDKLPPARHQELEEIVRRYVASYRDEAEVAAMSIEEVVEEVQDEPPVTRVRNDGYVAHGEAVVRKVRREQDGLLDFERRWRQHFLDTMQPKFLPAGWSVDHRRIHIKEMILGKPPGERPRKG